MMKTLATVIPGGRCAVSPHYVGTPHGGPVRAYRSATSTLLALVCDDHTAGAPYRGISWLRPVDVDADHAAALADDQSRKVAATA